MRRRTCIFEDLKVFNLTNASNKKGLERAGGLGGTSKYSQM